MADVTTKNIALALQESVAMRFSNLQGVQDFARTHADWNLLRSDGSPVLSWNEALAARPDGIIGFVGEEIMPAIRTTKVPVVCINSIHNLREFARVRSDAQAVGALAAKYFLELGYEEFAYVTDVPRHYYSQKRWEGFRDRLGEAGFPAKEIRLSAASAGLMDERFSQLKELADGCAVYCATDPCARCVLTFCEDSDIAVPEQLAVLGTDNDPFYCEGGRVMLSSIDVDHRKIGNVAAATMNQVLDGVTAKDAVVLVPPAKVVTRASTDPANSVSHPLVVKALKIIAQRADDPDFTTEELAKICGVSSRTIGRLFDQHRLRSPYQLLLNVRMNAAQRMLQESKLTAEQIAFQCGFADYSSFYRAFKSHVGISPSEFR